MPDYKTALPLQSDSENCVAHNGSLIPVPGRDIEVRRPGTRAASR